MSLTTPLPYPRPSPALARRGPVAGPSPGIVARLASIAALRCPLAGSEHGRSVATWSTPGSCHPRARTREPSRPTSRRSSRASSTSPKPRSIHRLEMLIRARRPVHQRRDSGPRSPDRGGRSAGGERMTHLAPPSVRLLVCGNADRGDDGAALSVDRHAAAVAANGVAGTSRGPPMRALRVEDLTDVRSVEIAVIVDAAVGTPPGHVVILPIRQDPRGGRFAGPALLARAAHRPGARTRPGASTGAGCPRASFVGIGGRRFGYGRPLSRSVRLNLPSFQAAIASELARLTHVPEGPVASG